MSFLVAGTPLTEWAKLTDNTVTDLYTATKRTLVVFMAAKETNNGTPTLTLRRLAADGSTTHMFRTAEAVTAKQRITFDEVFTLNPGEKLQAQSGSGTGDFDIAVSYMPPDAASR